MFEFLVFDGSFGQSSDFVIINTEVMLYIIKTKCVLIYVNLKITWCVPS